MAPGAVPLELKLDQSAGYLLSGGLALELVAHLLSRSEKNVSDIS
jgi:hypothetical protein